MILIWSYLVRLLSQWRERVGPAFFKAELC